MINAVTSCSAEGWAKFGEAFTRTFCQHWPPEVNLHIVSEDTIGLPTATRPIKFWPLQASKDAMDFLARHENNPRAHGKHPTQQRLQTFRYDAYKFSKKVFAIELVARELTGRLFWLDCDVVTFAPVPLDLLERLLPASFPLSCLQRPGYHSECGFVGYNLDQPACRDFIRKFADLYASEKVFTLEQWHDSWVFDWLRNTLRIAAYPIPHRSKSHPFINSELGQYMDHMKGARRKMLGRSPALDQLIHRKVPYWSRQR